MVIANDHFQDAYRTAMTLRNLPALVLFASLGAAAAEKDFDFAVGTFRSHVRRLQKPLTGSTTWFEAHGEVRARKILGGQGEVELNELDAPKGFEAVTLRLWNPATRQWSLHFANARRGAMVGPATVGEFKDGRGEFYDQEDWDGRMILVREAFSDIKADSYHFEQAFSADGGKTWETNWIADCQRVDSLPPLPDAADRNRDFDYSFGRHRARVSRLAAGKWTDSEGTAEVTPFWGGRGSLIEVQAGMLSGVAVRLYNPDAHTWNLNWVSASSMTLDVPTFGAFSGGRGEFVDVEPIGGRQAFVKQTFLPPAKFEQAVSFDGGRTWEPNLRITFEPLPRDG